VQRALRFRRLPAGRGCSHLMRPGPSWPPSWRGRPAHAAAAPPRASPGSSARARRAPAPCASARAVRRREAHGRGIRRRRAGRPASPARCFGARLAAADRREDLDAQRVRDSIKPASVHAGGRYSRSASAGLALEAPEDRARHPRERIGSEGGTRAGRGMAPAASPRAPAVHARRLDQGRGAGSSCRVCLVGNVRSARSGLLIEHGAVWRAHELGGEPVQPPLVVDDDVAGRRTGVGRVASPRGPR
jgi:hypothetical protein